MEILEAAWELFDEMGYDPVLMDDISERADVSRTSLYNYFPGGKEAIFFTTTISREQIMRSEILNRVPHDYNAIEKVVYMFSETLVYMLDHPLLIEAQRKFILYTSPQGSSTQLHLKIDRDPADGPGIDPAFLQSFTHEIMELEEYWVSVFTQGQIEGSIRKDIEPRQMTLLLWTTMTGLADQIHMRSHMFPMYNLDRQSLIEYSSTMLRSLFSVLK
jgi:AcrR family transcriptional regulator